MSVQHLGNCVMRVFIVLSKSAKETSEDVLAKRQQDGEELLGQNESLAEFAAVVLAKEQAVKHRNLVRHVAQGVKECNVFALIHVLHHGLHRNDHANPHLCLWVDRWQCAVIVLELGLIAHENAGLRTLDEVSAKGECCRRKHSCNESRFYHLCQTN
jgi:hypothetical protein